MHTIQINDDTYLLPACWDDLTPGQLLKLARLTGTDTPVEQIKVHMLLHCLRARVMRHKKIFREQVRIKVGRESQTVRFRVRRRSYLLTPEEVNTLADLFSFLVSRDEKTKTAYYIDPSRLVTNPFPTLRCRLHKFRGPDDQLLDITFEQFMYLQTYLDAMRADSSKIDYLLATIWHRGKTFDINRIDSDAALLRHLPEAKKIVMYWFILGSLSLLAAWYPRVFSGSGKPAPSGRVFDAQLRLLDSLAQSDMTRKPEVRRGLLLDALYSMDESIRRREEMEENIAR
ncbi:hypothetical protein [Bacteroides pyogenes]|uniref:hypothetical protein n=1 Tax=Bacteroides pyogenes TaxID=310300 RepID=UPI002FD8B8A6